MVRRDIAVVDDTHRGDTEAKQGEESQQHEVFILRYVREGRKLKIKKSSKGMCAFKGCATNAVHPRVLFPQTHKENNIYTSSQDCNKLSPPLKEIKQKHQSTHVLQLPTLLVKL